VILNDKQQKLVESNHNLIYYYAHEHDISIDDYYDVLALALCKAAYNYNHKKGAFSTFAMKCMKNELLQIYEKASAKKRIPSDKMSHYDNLWEINNFDNIDFSTESNVISKEVTNHVISKISKLLNNNEKNVLFLLLHGYKINEIAKIENRYTQNIHRNVKNIQKKITKSKILDEYNY
jgi:RNA polymerase sigma factor (sigma-70 family)